MATRSPWRDLRIPIRFGSELPVLLRHDPAPHTMARKKWRPITNHPGDSKPSGGLWTSPAVLPEGKWRPVPRRSAWTEWCEQEGMQTFVNYAWQTQIFPAPAAPFAVVDRAEDAVALYAAFPQDDHPLSRLLETCGLRTGIMSRMIDWKAMLSTGIAGVYLTHQGMVQTRLPDPDSGVPSLYTWDMATVWFGRPAFRVGKTWPSPRLPVENPEDDLPPREFFRRSRDRLRAAVRELEEGPEG
jgi:hypothetical protein